MSLFLSLYLLYFLKGESGRGVVENINEVPFAGSYFKALEVKGDIKYAYHRDNLRYHIAITLTGTTSWNSIEKFCSIDNKSWHQPVNDDFAEYLNYKLSYPMVKQSEFPIGTTEKDSYFRNDRTENDRHITIEISYRAKDGKFTAFIFDGPKVNIP